MSAIEEQTCTACGAVREQQSAEPVGKGYELRTLLCPKCRTVLKFVDKRPSKYHQHSNKPRTKGA